MADLAFIVLLTAWAVVVGHLVLQRLTPPPDTSADALALAVPLGFGLLAMAVLGLGLAGLLTLSGIIGVLTMGILAGWARPPLIRPGGPPPLPTERGPVDRAFDVALVAVVAGSLLTALAPVTDGDALCYHLQVPKIFLAAGALKFDPDLHETVYALVTESLYAVALALRGPVACRLIQWTLGLVFALNVTALARPVMGDRARWAGTIALLVPAVSNGMGAPLNDVALAAFGASALHAWVRWLDRPTTGAAVLAGLLAGLAIGVKYPALVWVGLVGAAMIACSARHPSRRRHVLLFAATALVVGGPWYLRAYLHTGNPVYPFFRHTFGGAGLDDVLDPASQPMVVTLRNVLAAPALMTLQPDRFDSFAHQFGPVFLFFLPGLLLFRPPRRVAWLVALGWAFLTLCITQRQSMRFVLIAIGPLSVGAAWVASEVARRKSVAARMLTCSLLTVMAFESLIAIGHARHGVGVVIGRESASDFLSRREPTYVIGRWIGANLPESARLIGQDHRGFYLPRPYTMELAHRRRTGLGRHGESAGEIVETLRSEGFTHLMLCPPVPETAVEFDPTLGRALAGWLSAREPLYREYFPDADGIVRRYAIFALDGRPLAGRVLAVAGRDR